MKRNPLGSILKKKIRRGGKTVTVYQARKRFTGPDGKQRERSKRCETYAEAQIALANLNNEVQSEQGREERTFFELTEYFETHYCKKAVIISNQKISGYRQRVKPIIRYLDGYKTFFGDRPLAQITYEDIRAYREHLATTKIGHRLPRFPAPATVNRKLAYLRRLFNIGKRLKWIRNNPFHDGEPLIKASAEKPRTRVLTFEEEERLLAACRRVPHLHLIVLTAIDTGMRQKEILSLRRNDIDLSMMVVIVRAENTKALKERIVPVSSRLAVAIRGYFSKTFVPAEGLVFGGLKSVKRSFATAIRTAEIRDLRFHDLRHTATTWMDQAGISEAAKRNMIGHSSDRVHQSYHNPSSDVLDEARRRIDEFHSSRRDRPSIRSPFRSPIEGES